MKHYIALGGMLAIASCSSWTKQDTAAVADIGKNILCAIEHAELDDPQLEAICGVLTAAEKQALTSHRRSLVEAKTIVVQAKCGDGGK